jgi:probable F420-dependent oxidoreductase
MADASNALALSGGHVSNRLQFGGLIEGDRTVAEAQRLERLGFEFVSSGEHLMRGWPPSPSDAVLVTLAAAAGATSTLRVASTIVLTPLYHPLWLAKLTTTLDVVSGGRFTLGVGIGGEHAHEFEAVGVPVSERGSRTDEILSTVKRLWAGEVVERGGKHFSFDRMAISPLPVQQPHPPIWVSGRHEAAMRRAAVHGDGWVPYFYGPAEFRRSVGRVREIADEIDRDISHFEWCAFVFGSMYDTVDRAVEVASHELGTHYFTRGRDWDAIVRSYCLVGPASAWIERLIEFIEAGANRVAFTWVCPAEDYERHVDLTANVVIPAVRKHFEQV